MPFESLATLASRMVGIVSMPALVDLSVTTLASLPAPVPAPVPMANPVPPPSAAPSPEAVFHTCFTCPHTSKPVSKVARLMGDGTATSLAGGEFVRKAAHAMKFLPGSARPLPCHPLLVDTEATTGVHIDTDMFRGHSTLVHFQVAEEVCGLSRLTMAAARTSGHVLFFVNLLHARTDGMCAFNAAHVTYQTEMRMFPTRWAACARREDTGPGLKTSSKARSPEQCALEASMFQFRCEAFRRQGVAMPAFLESNRPMFGVQVTGAMLGSFVHGLSLVGAILKGRFENITFRNVSFMGAVFDNVSFVGVRFEGFCSFLRVRTIGTLTVGPGCKTTQPTSTRAKVSVTPPSDVLSVLAAQGMPISVSDGQFDPMAVGLSATTLVDHPNCFLAGPIADRVKEGALVFTLARAGFASSRTALKACIEHAETAPSVLPFLAP